MLNMQSAAITTFIIRCIKCNFQLNEMKIVIILFLFIVICIVFSLFSQRLLDELLAFCPCFILLSKFFAYLKPWFSCFKHHYDERLRFIITLEHILCICQIMFENSIIFTERKFLSMHEIIRFFLLFLFFKMSFTSYFSFSLTRIISAEETIFAFM